MRLVSTSRRTVFMLTGITLLALVVRLAWTLWTEPSPPFLSDPEYYNATALSLARDFRYAVLFDGEGGFFPGGEATAFWPPGYSVFLAGWYWIFGEDLAVARLANVFAGSLIVVPVYFIGRRLFDDATAVVSAAMAALLPSLVFWTPVLMSDTFSTFLFACSLAFLVHSNRQDGTVRPGVLVLFALAVAAGAFVRGQALALLPLAVVWWALCGTRWRQIAAAGIGAGIIVLAPIVPWSIRNATVMDSPILLSANMGYNLRVGHAPYSTGRYLVPQDLWDERPGLSFKEREPLFNDLGGERGRTYALHHPLRELELAGRKIMWLWRPDSDALTWASTFGRTPLPDRAWEPLRILLDASYLATLALAAGAFAFRRWRRSVMFVTATVGLWTAIHVVFFGEPRYHLPMLVLIVPAAAAGGIGLIEKLKDQWPTRDPSGSPPPASTPRPSG